jgi:cytolysin (calcineurin-like family phosphatase)
VHLYQTSGRNAAKSAEQREGAAESGYAQLSQRDGLEAYELQEQDHEHDEMTLGSGSGDDDATKIGGEDEVDWMRREGSRVRI